MPNQSECKIDANGHKYWYLNDRLHRVEVNPQTGLTMPAVEYTNGSKSWCLNGQCHRVEINPETGLTMPAIEYANGYKSWYLNDQRHRIDGPAVEYSNGATQYWINGNHIPQLDNKLIYGKEKLAKYLLLI